MTTLQSTMNSIPSLHITFIFIIGLAQFNIIATQIDGIDQQEVSKTPVQRIFDPHLSWLAFVRNSNRATNRHRIKSGGGGGAGKRQGTLPIPQSPGPQGPQGPPGPPGPPGANITKEVLLNEFREMVKEVAEKRMEAFLDPAMQADSTTVLDDVDKKKSFGVYMPPLFDLDSVVILPKVTAGFFGRLSELVTVHKKSLCELKEFHVPFGDGAFKRSDDNTNVLVNGQYTITRTGIYQVFVNLHFRLKRKKIDNKKGALHVLVCIDSLCQTNVALESVLGAEQLGQHFSLSVAGFLHLQKGQFISVMIDNDTRNSISVQQNSYFSAILSGLFKQSLYLIYSNIP
uniref:THD domain-containing protein n=1 Tax=Strigamia maritima TaxID=126957 RepID=T1JGL2_STRMM